MSMTLFLFPNDFDATTAARRVLDAGGEIFPDIKFLYWSRNGMKHGNEDEFYKNIDKEAYARTAPPRSIQVLGITFLFQFWLFSKIKQNKPKYIVAFYFYTILPALAYKYLFDTTCMVIYDPRDYFAVCFKINRMLSWLLRFIDNLFIQMADRVIFPDFQYFRHYGMFRIKKYKYFVVPNSTGDALDEISQADIRAELGIPSNSTIIPIIGYFSDARGKAMLFESIKMNLPGVHFVVAGNMRNADDIAFFKSQPNVSYLGKIPYKKALWVMRNSAFVPLFYDPSLKNHMYAIPTKFYDSLMVGIPVVLSSQLIDAVALSRKHQLGFDLEYNDLTGFVNLICRFRDKQVDIPEKTLRNLYLEQFDFNIHASRLKAFYADVIKTEKQLLAPMPIAS
jgi:hypothetical protein